MLHDRVADAESFPNGWGHSISKMAALISATLLLPAGCMSAQNPITPGHPLIVLTPDQCNEAWSKAVTTADTPAQADAAPEIVSFAQVDDFAQVDINNDGTIEEKEFEAACGKGLVHAPKS